MLDLGELQVFQSIKWSMFVTESLHLSPNICMIAADSTAHYTSHRDILICKCYIGSLSKYTNAIVPLFLQ